MITKKDIIDKVMVRMKEVTPFDEGIVILSQDVNSIIDYIDGYLQASCDEILMMCPLSLTSFINFPRSGDPLKTTITEKTDNGRIIGSIAIPTDFLRIHTIKMSSWERPVHRPISVDNPLYTFQFNKHTRGGNAKPVVIQNDKLELYTYDSGATAEIATYVPKINLDYININEKLIEPLVSLIAANVYAQYGHPQQKVMMAEVETLLKLE